MPSDAPAQSKYLLLTFERLIVIDHHAAGEPERPETPYDEVNGKIVRRIVLPYDRRPAGKRPEVRRYPRKTVAVPRDEPASFVITYDDDYRVLLLTQGWSLGDADKVKVRGWMVGNYQVASPGGRHGVGPNGFELWETRLGNVLSMSVASMQDDPVRYFEFALVSYDALVDAVAPGVIQGVTESETAQRERKDKWPSLIKQL